MRTLMLAAMVGGVFAASGNALSLTAEKADRVTLVTRAFSELYRDQEPPRAEAKDVSTLRVSQVRLEAPPAEVSKPAALLKFDLLNDGALRVTVLVEITIFERSQSDTRPRRIIAGPVTIRGYATIEAGYTVSYEMLLRNLAADCACDPHVSIVSARPLPIL